MHNNFGQIERSICETNNKEKETDPKLTLHNLAKILIVLKRIEVQMLWNECKHNSTCPIYSSIQNCE